LWFHHLLPTHSYLQLGEVFASPSMLRDCHPLVKELSGESNPGWKNSMFCQDKLHPIPVPSLVPEHLPL
jgi:hypothetical protein